MTVLVIDVLRASTTIITALSNGCDAIVPVADPQDARRRATEARNGSALVAGERQGEPIPGFDLSNSPVEFQSPHVRGKTVYFTPRNGRARCWPLVPPTRSASPRSSTSPPPRRGPPRPGAP